MDSLAQYFMYLHMVWSNCLQFSQQKPLSDWWKISNSKSIALKPTLQSQRISIIPYLKDNEKLCMCQELVVVHITAWGHLCRWKEPVFLYDQIRETLWNEQKKKVSSLKKGTWWLTSRPINRLSSIIWLIAISLDGEVFYVGKNFQVTPPNVGACRKVIKSTFSSNT